MCRGGIKSFDCRLIVDPLFCDLSCISRFLATTLRRPSRGLSSRCSCLIAAGHCQPHIDADQLVKLPLSLSPSPPFTPAKSSPAADATTRFVRILRARSLLALTGASERWPALTLRREHNCDGSGVHATWAVLNVCLFVCLLLVTIS